MKKLLLIGTCLLLFVSIQAQERNYSSRKGKSSIGIGFGLPYGGLGVNLSTNVANGLGLFTGIGYMITGVGYNFGVSKNIIKAGKVDIYALGMYGTNAGINIENDSSYDEIYLGPSFGAGVKINSRRRQGNYWNIGLMVPLRSSEYHDMVRELKNNSRLTDFKEPGDVLIYVGYNIKF
jgi:hypothetical protein